MTIIGGEVKADWSPLTPGAQLVVTRYADRLQVVPVTDSGVEYPVPTQHCGAPIDNLDVLTIARAAAAYVEWMVSDAQPLRR